MVERFPEFDETIPAEIEAMVESIKSMRRSWISEIEQGQFRAYVTLLMKSNVRPAIAWKIAEKFAHLPAFFGEEVHDKTLEEMSRKAIENLRNRLRSITGVH